MEFKNLPRNVVDKIYGATSPLIFAIIWLVYTWMKIQDNHTAIAMAEPSFYTNVNWGAVLWYGLAFLVPSIIGISLVRAIKRNETQFEQFLWCAGAFVVSALLVTQADVWQWSYHAMAPKGEDEFFTRALRNESDLAPLFAFSGFIPACVGLLGFAFLSLTPHAQNAFTKAFGVAVGVGIIEMLLSMLDFWTNRWLSPFFTAIWIVWLILPLILWIIGIWSVLKQLTITEAKLERDQRVWQSYYDHFLKEFDDKLVAKNLTEKQRGPYPKMEGQGNQVKNIKNPLIRAYARFLLAIYDLCEAVINRLQ